MADDCPELLEYEGQYREQITPLDIKIWCTPNRVAEWDKFIREHDLPNEDYVNRWMIRPVDDPQLQEPKVHHVELN